MTDPLTNADAYNAAADAELRRRFPDDFMLFARCLTIPSADGPKLFADCMAPFQEETFGALQPSLDAVRKGRMPTRRRFWIERTKKSSKDLDLAVCLLHLTAYTLRPLLVQVCAANNEQARIVEDRAIDLLFHNPWLNDLVEIVQSRIRSRLHPREVRVRIESTGTPGEAQGPTPDLLVLNELVHVTRWSVMEAHRNNADGVPRGVVIISTNAGIKGTRAHLWRQIAFEDQKRWSIHVWSKRAPWLSEGDVEDARKRDPIGAEFARLYRGVWISGSGGSVDEATINAAFRADGPMRGPEPGWRFVAGLDLGVDRDHAGLAVVGVNAEGRVRVAGIKGWVPNILNNEGKMQVDLQAVEDRCLEVWQRYKIEWFGYDPAAGGSYMAQRLARAGVPMREVTFSSPKNLTDMAEAFVTMMKDGVLECYEDREGRLRRDIGKFQIQPRLPSGYRLVATSDEHGHADVGTALVICLPAARRMLAGWASLLGPDDQVADAAVEPLTDDELDEMPPELRDIYDSASPDTYERYEMKRYRKKPADYL